jgi:hypothetical protein
VAGDDPTAALADLSGRCEALIVADQILARADEGETRGLFERHVNRLRRPCKPTRGQSRMCARSCSAYNPSLPCSTISFRRLETSRRRSAISHPCLSGCPKTSCSRSPDARGARAGARGDLDGWGRGTGTQGPRQKLHDARKDLAALNLYFLKEPYSIQSFCS